MYMINIALLSLLGVIDAVKKEIHIFVLIPISLFWLATSVYSRGVDIIAVVATAILIGLSLITRQAFGMADAIVLSLISFEGGVIYMLFVFFLSDLLFVVFTVAKYGFKQRNRSFPLIPFIAIVYVFAKLFLKEAV
jgi:hypothetical protein